MSFKSAFESRERESQFNRAGGNNEFQIRDAAVYPHWSMFEGNKLHLVLLTCVVGAIDRVTIHHQLC